MAASIRKFQPGILAGVLRAARDLALSLADPERVRDALAAVATVADGDTVVAGVSARGCCSWPSAPRSMPLNLETVVGRGGARGYGGQGKA